MPGPQDGTRANIATLVLCTAFGFAPARAEPSVETIAHGKALTEAADCGSCHTADCSKPFAGGKRIDTPFGGLFSANLTPDRDTGLGAWSDDDFVRALRYGIAPDGSRYYPAFPYPHFTKLIRPDILAIRAYLDTLPPVRNTPPPPQLRWPLNYRVLMRVWNFAFFRPGILNPTRTRAQSGTAEPIWSRARRIAAHATRPGISSAPRSAARNLAARRSTAGLRRGSMAPAAAGSNRGASRTSPNICRAAATPRAMPAGRWPKSCSIRPQG